MNRTTATLSVLASLATAASTAAGAVVISEDFEGIASITDGAFTNNDNGSLDTAGDPFNLGSGNTYVRQDDGSTTSGGFVGILDSPTVQSAADGSVFSVNFLFNEPTVADRNDNIAFRVGDSQDSNAVAIDLRFDDGVLSASNSGSTMTAAYALDTVFGLDVVGNESGATITYNGGETLPNDSYDVYLTDAAGNTTLVLNDQGFRNTGETLDTVIFQTFGSARQQFAYDNFRLSDDATVLGVTPIPEPASVAAMGLLGLVALRRRSR